MDGMDGMDGMVGCRVDLAGRPFQKYFVVIFVKEKYFICQGKVRNLFSSLYESYQINQ